MNLCTITHKSADQLVAAYNRAGLMAPNTVKAIRQVVNDCKVCQKFGKSLVKSKIALAKGGSFNEIVTLDLKQFGSRYILWCIDSFTRFAQGKLINNKKADTIMNALEECWNLPFGIPSIGYYADNGTEFKNVKMDGEYKNFRIVETGSNHYGIEIENKDYKLVHILY